MLSQMLYASFFVVKFCNALCITWLMFNKKDIQVWVVSMVLYTVLGHGQYFVFAHCSVLYCLFQTVSWLSGAPAVLEECARSASQPQLLRTLLQHEKCLGHLDSSMSGSWDDQVIAYGEVLNIHVLCLFFCLPSQYLIFFPFVSASLLNMGGEPIDQQLWEKEVGLTKGFWKVERRAWGKCRTWDKGCKHYFRLC